MGPVAGFGADGAASSTGGLIKLGRRRGWQGVVLASQPRLVAAPDHLRALIDLYRSDDFDIVYDGDDPDWSEVVSVETLERYGSWARARFGGAQYPHRFYHFQRECAPRVGHIGLPHRVIENLYAATRRTLLLESQGIPYSNRSYKERVIHRLRRPFGHGGSVLPPTRGAIAEFDSKMFNMWLFSPELIATLLRQVGFRDVTILR